MIQGTFICRSETTSKLAHFLLGNSCSSERVTRLSYLEQKHTASQGGDGLCLGENIKLGIRRSLTFSKSLWTTISYLQEANTLWPASLATFDVQRCEEHIANSKTDR